MAASERLAAGIHAGTGPNGHRQGLSGMVLGKHRLFAGGSPEPANNKLGETVQDLLNYRELPGLCAK